MDAVVVGVLLIVGAVLRWHALPTDGLFHDDAWVALGVTNGSFDQVFGIGNTHPGYSALLMTLSPVLGSEPSAYTGPAFVAGVLGAPVVYLMLRLSGFSAAVALLPAAGLAAADVHVTYSGRVKPYVLEVLVVVALVLAVRFMAERRWGWRETAGWAVGSLVVSVFSAFSLLCAAVAGAVLLTVFGRDWWRRAIAVGVQAVGAVWLLVTMQSSYDSDWMQDLWAGRLDGYVDTDSGVLSMLGDIANRVGRSTVVISGEAAWVYGIVGAIAAVGLVSLAWRVPWGRFPLALLVVALAGSVAGRLPFGSSTFEGLRVSVWFAPVAALGVAEALRLVVDRVPRSAAKAVLPAAAVASCVVLGAGFLALPSYPWDGTDSASEFVDEQLVSADAAIVLYAARFPYAAETELPVEIEPAPSEVVGLRAEILDPRVRALLVSHQPSSDERAITEAVRGADRVIVYSGVYLPGSPDGTPQVDRVLMELGYQREELQRFDHAGVAIWVR